MQLSILGFEIESFSRFGSELVHIPEKWISNIKACHESMNRISGRMGNFIDEAYRRKSMLKGDVQE